jgi:hypothetical protein
MSLISIENVVLENQSQVSLLKGLIEGTAAELVEHDTITKLKEQDMKCTIIVYKGASKKCEHGKKKQKAL